jgi:hypothetical protein
MRKSTDFGVTFGKPILVTSLRTTGVGGDLGLTDNIGRHFRSNAFPQAAVNPVTGNVYVVYDDVGTGPGDKSDVYFRQSTNGGASWGRQIKVNDDHTTTDQWQPGLAVMPDGKQVGVFWYDRRNDPGNNLIDRFGAIATLSGPAVNFGENFRVTTASFAPSFGQDPETDPAYMGDYDQVAADSKFFYTTWGDNSLASKGHAAFNADVRFAKIPVEQNAPAVSAAPAAAVSAIADSRTVRIANSPGAAQVNVTVVSDTSPRLAEASAGMPTPGPALKTKTSPLARPRISAAISEKLAVLDEFFMLDPFQRHN